MRDLELLNLAVFVVGANQSKLVPEKSPVTVSAVAGCIASS
jgi:hypothetical protein